MDRSFAPRRRQYQLPRNPPVPNFRRERGPATRPRPPHPRRKELSFTAVASSAPFVKAGKLKVVAIVEKNRHNGYPEVQTIAEVVPGFEKPAGLVLVLRPRLAAQTGARAPARRDRHGAARARRGEVARYQLAAVVRQHPAGKPSACALTSFMKPRVKISPAPQPARN